jgi:hypothetical protein
LTAGAAVSLDETMALMFALHGGEPADSGARRTSAVPVKCGQPCANPWCEGNLRMDGRDPNTLQKDVARNVRAGRGTGKRWKNRDFGRENRYYPVQGFCFASIGPRFSPFVVVLLPRKISTLFDSA